MKHRSDNSLGVSASGSAASPETIDLSKAAFGTIDYQTPTFTWEQVVRILRKNWRLGLAISGVSIALTLAAVMVMKDVYEPVARIEIAPPMSGIRTLHEIESPAEVDNHDYLETQAQILKSDALAVSVIRQLQLNKRKDFTGRKFAGAEIIPPTADPSKGLRGGDKAFLREQVELATLTPSESIALERFRTGLSVNPIRNTRLVEVSFASHDAKIAREVTNEVIAQFIANSYQQRYKTTTQASEWLSSQLSDLHQKVVASNRAVSDYQRQYGLVEMDDRDVPLSQLMGEANHQLSEAQANRIENEAYLQMIDTGQAEYVPALRDDRVYQDLLIRQADVRSQLAQTKAVYGDANTNVKRLEDQLSEIARQIDEERKRIAERIRTGYATAKERERLMLRDREKLRAQMVDANSQVVGYQILKSEAIANAELYNTLQARLKEAGIYAGLGSDNIRVVDLAENLQKPTGPHRAAWIAIGELMGGILGIAACFFKESLNNTVRTPEDVRLWAGLKSLALVPVIGADNSDGAGARPTFAKFLYARNASWPDTAERCITLMRPLTAEAEAIRDLRTALLSSRMRDGGNVILISSALENEGKTTVAVNFAMALAKVGRTCLMDADLRQPMVGSAFHLEPRPGLAEVLQGAGQLNNALVASPDLPSLWLLPSGAPVESPADVLASARMQDVCKLLRQQYQFLVIDSPPIIRFSDARHLSRLADAVVVVGRCGITTRRAMQRSAELLNDVQAPIAGVVLNGIDYSSPDYHYFNYGYSRTAGRLNGSGSTRASLPTGPPQENREAKSMRAKA